MPSINSSVAGDILFVLRLLSRVYNTLIIIIIIIRVDIRLVCTVCLCVLILRYYNITCSCGRYRRGRRISRHRERDKCEEHTNAVAV